MITRVVVEHQDRLTRFGFRSIETLLEIQGRTIEVVNPEDNNKEDLLHDVASIVYSICARPNAAVTCQTEGRTPR
jgi:predicted site-specific integrase-resolvase